MITLFQPPQAWGLPSISPFCVKVETYLRMTEIPYETRIADIRKAPKGRVPYIRDSETGALIGDSGFILDYLREKHGDKLDQKLSVEQRAQALVFRRMIEEHHYFVAAWFRWTEPVSWNYVRNFFVPLLPPVIGGLIMNRIRASFMKMINAQGVGAHTRTENLKMARENIDAISVMLGDRPFYLGDEPTSIDATLYGFLVQLIWVPWDGDLQTQARGHRNLVEYCHRMQKRYFPEANIPAARA